MADINLTRKQTQWLNSRGGRNFNDVEKDEEGIYIWMSDGNGKSVKIRLPD